MLTRPLSENNRPLFDILLELINITSPFSLQQTVFIMLSVNIKIIINTNNHKSRNYPYLKTLGSLLGPMRNIIHLVPVTSNLRLLSAQASSVAEASSTSTNAASNTVPPTESSGGEPDKLYSKLELELKGNDPAVLKSYAFFASTAAQHLDIEVGKK